MAPASAPAPALDVEGGVGGGNSQNALKSEADVERSVAPGGGSAPGEFRADDPATAVCEDGINSSDNPALAVDVNGKGDGGKENLGKVRVKSEPEHCEGEGAVLAPCTRPAGADFVGIASSSYKLPVASPEDSTDERGGDSTECSSSFADSCCETGDEAGNGDPEVNSPFSAHANGGQASAMPRKKKVTAEWRNAVRPMLWRCEWLELRMKDLLSQVSKYDSQLALIEQEKELQRATSKTNGCRQESGKNCRDHENISMERRKRKRHEDTVDTSLYLKKHKILSYFFGPLSIYFLFVGIVHHFIPWLSMFCTRILLVIIRLFLSSTDKQNKGADADGLLIDDDSHGQVGDDTRRRLEIVGLPASKEYDMVSNQFVLQKVLMQIGGIQSRVHRLQERLSKARCKQAKLASFMDHDQVKVAEKRQRIQKRAFSPENDRYAKPQKKKKLNILLEQEDRPTLSVKPTLSERGTDCLIEDPQGNSEEKALERSQAHKKDITVDLLLAVESSLPNGHLGDLCKENTDDILIDNQGAKDGYQPFENAKHPPEEPPVLIENVAKTAPSKVGNTSEPVEAEKSSVPLVKQEVTIGKLPVLKHVYSGKKRGRTPKTEDMGSEAASKNHNKEASETPSAKQKAETTPCAENENAGSKMQEIVDIRSPSKKSNSGNSCSAAEKLKIGNSSSAAKAQKSGNSSSAAKAPKTGNSSSDGNKQAAGNSSSAAKKPKMGNSSSDGKKQAAGNSFTAAKPKTGKSSPDGKKQAAGNSSAPARTEMSENIHTNLRIEKAILVEVNSRRSQRVRKPKVY
ncbi:uncharacterized protein [Aegilops tauschii subsp. strangulata]|uniref:uncharacterized protein isoform X1 n=1 Tax=Aegilops tauschii subsp. strangulata TaxID=200361 RepID=UPI00098B51E8|nr:uncharacterized protein LOC109780837 isoform X1 [Aegilops tauschii subsp. strangulata]